MTSIHRPALATCLALAGIGATASRADDYAIRDGDTVVFLGDSITAERTCGKIVEQYTLLRYPERRVRFINAGQGGDTAAGGLKRLERDVFARGATLVTVAYGINDIGWGFKADDEHRQLYLDSIRSIVEKCRERGVRVFICSAALTAGDTGDDNYLQKMCDEGMAISRSLGQGAIDVQRTMRAIQKRINDYNARLPADKPKETMFAPDGIHLNGLGQLAMGFAIIKGLGAPAMVSSVAMNAGGDEIATEGCRVESVSASPTRITFMRIDEGWPMYLEPLWGLNFRFIPFPDELGRYMLTIRGLEPGKYAVTVNDRLVAKYSAEDLGRGVNLGPATPDPWIPGGPWQAQSFLLKRLTDARTQIALDQLYAPEFLAGNPKADDLRKQLDALDESILAAQRAMAKPIPLRYVIERIDE